MGDTRTSLPRGGGKYAGLEADLFAQGYVQSPPFDEGTNPTALQMNIDTTGTKWCAQATHPSRPDVIWAQSSTSGSAVKGKTCTAGAFAP